MRDKEFAAIFLSVFVAWLLLRVIAVVMGIRQLYATPVRRTLRRQIEVTEVPVHLAPLLTEGGRQLAALGFEPWICTTYTPLFGGKPRWTLYCWSPATRTLASVATHLIPEGAWPLSFSFTTRFTDGTILSTLNGERWALVAEHPRAVINDPYLPTLRQQWESHRAELARLERAPRDLRPEEVVAEENQDTAEIVDGMLRSRMAVQGNAPDELRMKLWGSTRATLRMLFRARRYRDFVRMRALAKVPAVRVSVPVEVEADAYPFRTAPPLSAAGKAALLAITLAASLLVLPTLHLSGHTAALLMGVLLLHELGHWAAMKVFGYRDTTVFFVPFLGAATWGRNDDATPAQRVVMYLMGPVPGYLLGIGLLAWLRTHPAALPTAWIEPAYELAWLLAVVNATNLLPIMPLDGGQVVSLLLFGRSPRVELGFRWLGVAALLAATFLLHAPPLSAIALVVALSTWGLVTRSKVSIALREARDGGLRDEQALVLHGFRWFREAGVDLPYVRKAAMIRNALRAPPALGSRGTAAGLLAAYVGLLCVGPVAWAKYWNPPASAPEASGSAPGADVSRDD
jgi:Zn-dependent protease